MSETRGRLPAAAGWSHPLTMSDTDVCFCLAPLFRDMFTADPAPLCTSLHCSEGRFHASHRSCYRTTRPGRAAALSVMPCRGAGPGHSRPHPPAAGPVLTLDVEILVQLHQKQTSAITRFRHFLTLDLTSEVTGSLRTLSLYTNRIVSRRATRSFFFREALAQSGAKRHGGRAPCAVEGCEMACAGEG